MALYSSANGWTNCHSRQPAQSQDFTADLNHYFNNEVQLYRAEIRRCVGITLPIVREILDHINTTDPRFKSDPIYVGSYWSGLKVDRPDEFDISVALNIPENFSWTESSPCYYNVSQYDPSQIVKTTVPLPSPPTGYCRSKYYERHHVWQSHTSPRLTFDNYLIPMYVKNAFKKYLKDAVRVLNMRGQVSVSRKEAGPALTIYIKDPDSKKDEGLISVDFAPMLQARLPFPSSIQWPRPGTFWPPRDKVAKIKEIGINEVPKRDLEWYLSFAECEKELIRQIDKEGENTNRKKLHRIMKKLTHDIWCPGQKPVLSSYILKNVLFWECEEFPKSREWENDNMWERFCSLTNRLLQALTGRSLKLYFYPKVDLLKDKEESKLDAVIQNIYTFMQNPAYYLRPG